MSDGGKAEYESLKKMTVKQLENKSKKEKVSMGSKTKSILILSLLRKKFRNLLWVWTFRTVDDLQRVQVVRCDTSKPYDESSKYKIPSFIFIVIF